MLNRIKDSFPLKLTLIHFLFMLACGFFTFFNLTHWDGEWYRQIVEIGYNTVHSADRFAEGKGNVGFFPGYPLAVYLVKKLLGFGSDAFPTTGALLIVSNLFALLTWVYLEKLLFLFQNISPLGTGGESLRERKNAHLKMILLALYPFSFFFYCAYTESLFTAMILGFVYFCEKMLREENKSKALRFFFLALLHGFFMNFTRLLGVVVVFYPLIRALQSGQKEKRSALLALGSLVSPVLFFIYCQIRFGAWDFYFQTERAIWGTYIDLAKLFPPKTLFDFARPFHANTTSKYVTILTGGFLTWKLLGLLKDKHYREPVFAMVLICGMVWGEYLLGRTSWDYAGMGRYMVPVFALMLPFVKLEPKRNWKWILIGSVLIGFQIAYALKFGRHGWVA